MGSETKKPLQVGVLADTALGKQVLSVESNPGYRFIRKKKLERILSEFQTFQAVVMQEVQTAIENGEPWPQVRQKLIPLLGPEGFPSSIQKAMDARTLVNWESGARPLGDT